MIKTKITIDFCNPGVTLSLRLIIFKKFPVSPGCKPNNTVTKYHNINIIAKNSKKKGFHPLTPLKYATTSITQSL